MNSFIDKARNILISNNSNNLLNNNFINNTSINSVDSIISRESKYKSKPTKLAAALSNSIEGVALDSACTESSYRISDAIAHNIDITQISPHETFNITAAGGESIKSCAKGILK